MADPEGTISPIPPEPASSTGQSVGSSQPANVVARGLETHSLLDMELCEAAELAMPIPPHATGPLEDASTNGDHRILDSLQRAVLSLQSTVAHNALTSTVTLDQLKMEVKDAVERIPSRIEELLYRQRTDLESSIESHVTYLNSQFTATFNWRLKHLHNALIQDTRATMQPFFTALQQVQSDVVACSRMMDSFNAELPSLRQHKLCHQSHPSI